MTRNSLSRHPLFSTTPGKEMRAEMTTADVNNYYSQPPHFVQNIKRRAAAKPCARSDIETRNSNLETQISKLKTRPLFDWGKKRQHQGMEGRYCIVSITMAPSLTTSTPPKKLYKCPSWLPLFSTWLLVHHHHHRHR